VGVGHPYEEDDFEGDYIVDSETEVEDNGLMVTVIIWKRTRLRI